MDMKVATTVNLEAVLEKPILKSKTFPISLIEVNNDIQDEREIDQTFVDEFVIPACREYDIL